MPIVVQHCSRNMKSCSILYIAQRGDQLADAKGRSAPWARMSTLACHLCATRVDEQNLVLQSCGAQAHFFLPPPAASSLRSHEMTLPNITTPFPSMNATRDKPSQFLNVSHTKGCCGPM